MTRSERGERVPEMVGPYQVRGLLGKGGMGEVYRGFDQRLDRPVALKRIRPSASDPEIRRARFQREARAVARLSHSTIVQVHDWVEDGDDLWIVMELVDGQPLRTTMDSGRLEPRRAARLAGRIAEGLAAAHAAGIVHRDLKAENVMLTEEDGVKLLDFGLAKLYRGESDPPDGSISTSGQILGTVRYLSPEQALGHPVDHRSDLFSLGSLLFEMLTGTSPFKGATTVETLSRICSHKQPPVSTLAPDVPQALAELVDQLLLKDRIRRPRETREVAERLTEISQLPASFEEPSVQTGEETATVLEASWTQDLATPAGEPRRLPASAWIMVCVGLLLTVAVIVAAIVGHRWRAESPEAPDPLPLLYVAVPPTVVKTASEGETPSKDDLTAEAVHAGLLRALLGFEGTAAVEPISRATVELEASSLARALGADEVLRSTLSCAGSFCRVALTRIAGTDGRVLWSHTFSTERINLLNLTTRTSEQLRGGYPTMELRTGVPNLEADPEEWRSFLRFERAFWTRSESQSVSTEALLQDLAELQHRAPRLLEAPLLEATVARIRFQETRSAADLERASAALDRARLLAPGDPRVVKATAQLWFVSGRLDDADATLDSIAELEPGDADLMALRAEILERRGDLSGALALMHEAVRRQPSWGHHTRLAEMVYRSGDIAAARAALEASLERLPNNYDTLSRLAQIELLSGSPERAAEHYETLVERWPGETELTNLGVAYTLLTRYDEAAEYFRRALAHAPSSPHALYNLADAEILRGEEKRADELYQQVLDQIARDPDPEHLQTLAAQAEARLGRFEQAVELAHEALQRAPDNPQVRYEAAVALVLAGEDLSALLSARRALELGVEPRWFEFPWFDPLRARLLEDG